MKKITLYLLLAAILSLAGMPPARGEEAQKREMRMVWVATVSNIDWPQTRGSSATTIAQQKKQLTDIDDANAMKNIILRG